VKVKLSSLRGVCERVFIVVCCDDS
jgi:hypothetical protein